MKPQFQQKFAIRKQMVVMFTSEKSTSAGRTATTVGTASVTASTIGQ